MSEATTPLAHYADLNPQTIDATTYGNSDFEYVDLAAVKAGVLHSAETERHTFTSAPSRARRLVEPGDFLFGTVRPQLRPHAWPGRSCVASTGFTVVRAKRGVADIRFLGHFLLSDEAARQVAALEVGSSYPAVNERDVGRLRLPHVSLEEQQRIAEVLDTIDEEIQATERVIAKLETVRTGALQRLLSDLHSRPTLRVEEIADVTVGIVVRPTQYYKPTGIPILRSANVRERGVTLDDLVYMSKDDHELMSKSAVRPGDLLTVRTGYPGTSAVVPSSLREANCVDIVITRPGPAIDSAFLALWVNSDLGKGHVLRRQGGLAQQHFNVKDMKGLPIPDIDLELQASIVRSDQAFTNRLEAEAAHADAMRQVRDGLAADLLSGRVRTVAA